jgi:alanine racemase
MLPNFPEIELRGLISHFPRADEADQSYSTAQLARFRRVVKLTDLFSRASIQICKKFASYFLPMRSHGLARGALVGFFLHNQSFGLASCLRN